MHKIVFLLNLYHISELGDLTAPSGADTDGVFEGNDLSIRFSWSRPRSLLEKPPLTAGGVSPTIASNSMPTIMSSGTSELNAVIVPGDSKLPCYPMYEELETIKGFVSGLDGQGRRAW